MRSSRRRLSLALKFSNKPLDHKVAAGPDLAQFLSTSKEKYLSDVRASKGGEWTVVMGNEAGDLDSVASSISFAWLQSEIHKKPTIPLMQLQRDDLDLRPENIYALQLAGIDQPKQQLLFLTDLAEFTPFPSHSFALVDHNRLSPSFTDSNPSATVTAIIDHHADEGLYTSTASPRTIAPSGSCTSHIAALCPKEVPPALATLLLCAILIDTNGLKPGGRATPTDIHAAAFLAPRSTLAPSIPPKLTATLLLDDPARPPEQQTLHDTPALRELTRTLSTKKADVSRLSGRDLLRRDFKDYTYTTPSGREVQVGIASVPIRLKAMGEGGALATAASAWMAERGLAVLGVLTSFRGGKNGKGKHKREMAWVVRDGKDGGDTEGLAGRLWKGLEGSGELELRRHKKFDLEKGGGLPDGARTRVYRQGNANATRKVTAPLVKRILEAPEPEENGKK